MSQEERHLHCIRVRAYFLALKRQKEGIDSDPEADWLAAEYEEDRSDECYVISKKIEAADATEQIRLTVLLRASRCLNMKPSEVTADTRLPVEHLANICRGTGHSHVPVGVHTVGELTKSLQSLPLPAR